MKFEISDTIFNLFNQTTMPGKLGDHVANYLLLPRQWDFTQVYFSWFVRNSQ